MSKPQINQKGRKVRNSAFLIIFFISLFVVLAIFPESILVVLVALALWAMIGQAQALEALSLSAIIKYLNPAIYDFPESANILVFAVMFIASGRIIITISGKHLKILLPLIMFFLVVVGLSLDSSANPEVSIMKVIFFTMMVSAILIASYRQPERVVDRWKIWFMSLSVAVITLSLVTLVDPHIAYFRNGKGFQGLFNHPQVFGPWTAVLSAGVLFAVLKEGKENKVNRIFLLLLLGFFLSIVVASKARTGMVSFLLSSITTYLIVIFSKRDMKIPIWKSMIITITGVFILGIVFAYFETAGDIVDNYIHKDGEQNTVQAFSHSRGSAAKRQWRNFLDKPLTGNGFGVYPNGHFPSGIKRFYGVPISAPVEKGFLPTAIFEEIGIVGVVFFLIFITRILGLVIKGGDPTWISVFLACLYLNIGEAVLFSVGGIGLYYWCLMGLCLANAVQIEKVGAVNNNCDSAIAPKYLYRHNAE